MVGEADVWGEGLNGGVAKDATPAPATLADAIRGL